MKNNFIYDCIFFQSKLKSDIYIGLFIWFNILLVIFPIIDIFYKLFN